MRDRAFVSVFVTARGRVYVCEKERENVCVCVRACSLTYLPF
jgi:hypothetical protein